MFRNAFPFEGNRNRQLAYYHRSSLGAFRNAFPFEGNRNLRVLSLFMIDPLGSETPSRLKGIETYLAGAIPILRCCSETPSRLKGIETMTLTRFRRVLSESSETPSRLKGIETLHPHLLVGHDLLLVQKRRPV